MADLVTLDEMSEELNLGDDTSHDAELEQYIAAVTAHVEREWGVLPSSEVTEIALVVDLGDGTPRLSTAKPVLDVASISDGTNTYTTDITVTPDGYVEHDELTSRGRWTIVYTGGYAEIPPDLKLAVLEDIRGIYQPGQIGPPAAFGAFGIENTDVGPTYRPVRMWPRVDGWLGANTAPVIA